MRVYLRLGRVSNLPTVWTNCLAGIVLADVTPAALPFSLLILSMSLLYVSGMFLNDAFDQEFDRKYRKERPIPAGEISGRAVFAIGFGLMASGLLVLLIAARGALGWGLVLALLILYYDSRHKKDPASPVVMGLCRVMVYFSAAASGASALSGGVMGGAGVLLAYMIGLTYVAKQENLTEVKNLWPVALLIAPFIYTIPSIQFFLFLGWVLYALSHLLSKNRKNIPRAVVSLIAGISLLDGLLIASATHGSLLSWFGLAGFLLTLLFQKYIPGT